MKYFCKDCRDPVPNIIEDYSNGDVVCATCGLVLGPRIIDTRSEWRTFANDDGGGDDPSRVGAFLLLDAAGMSLVEPLLRIGQAVQVTLCSG